MAFETELKLAIAATGCAGAAGASAAGGRALAAAAAGQHLLRHAPARPAGAACGGARAPCRAADAADRQDRRHGDRRPGAARRMGSAHTPGRFDFAALVDDTALADELQALAGTLVPVFTTDFTRRRWLVTHRKAQIEVALDRGRITSATRDGPRSLPLLELELELKARPGRCAVQPGAPAGPRPRSCTRSRPARPSAATRCSRAAGPSR